MTEESSRVSRRQVFFIAGFDPAGPHKYYGIFTDESARQAALTGTRIEVGPLGERGELVWAWRVRALTSDQPVEIDYQYLRWNDVVRRFWPRQGPRLFLDIWRAFFAYCRRGVLALPSRTVRAHVLVPVGVMTAFMLIYAAAVAGLCWLGAALAQAADWDWRVGAVVPLLLWLAVVPVWRQVNLLIPVVWLGRAMVLFSGAERGLHGEIEARQEAFARLLVDAVRQPGWDEILIVGHSMGCQLAVRALGQAVRLDPMFGKRGTPVSLLTLGKSFPLYSMMTDDPAYQRDFEALIEARHIPWIDITSRPDPGSAGHVHPLTGLGLGVPSDRPVRRTPRFHAILTRATYRRLRWSPLDYHFQYLKAAEVAGGYDFFRIVTGPCRLSQTTAAGTDIVA